MDEEISCNKSTFARILKTILLFLENNNFQQTANVLNNEIENKLPDIGIKGIQPRTVILRPMDITTNVDATISDENLIICISGVNSAAHKKKLDNRNRHDPTDLLNALSTSVISSEELCSTPPPANLQEVEECVDADGKRANKKDADKYSASHRQKVSVKRAEVLRKPASEEVSTEGFLDENIDKMAHDNKQCVKKRVSSPFPTHLYKAKSASPTRIAKGQSPKKVKSNPVSPKITKRGQKTLEGNGETEITSDNISFLKSLEHNSFMDEIKLFAHNNQHGKESPKTQMGEGNVETNKSDIRLVDDGNATEEESEIHADDLNYDEKASNGSSSYAALITPTNSEVPLLPPQNDGASHKSTEPGKVASGSSISMKKQFCQLNYKEVKNVLRNGACELKLKILQALRWRLTRADSKIRDNNLVCYVTHDILDIGEGSHFFEQNFKIAKDCNTMAMQEEASRFINTLASLSMGREYLEKCSNLIQILVPILKNTNGDERMLFQSLTRQFVMATIQKLSLGGKIRRALINEGVVEWLIKYMLKYHDLMTDYEAEYSVALFSNLCIHKTMRELCEATPDETAKLLKVLVYTPHKCCLPYLSGILGSLLTSSAINTRAAELNIKKKLKSLAECAGDDETRHQLEFIIQLHESTSHCKCEYDVVEEPQIYSDHLECELGMNETNYSNPVGEQFLEGYCSTTLCLEKHVQVVKRSCSAISNQQLGDNYEVERCNIMNEVPWTSAPVNLAPPPLKSQSCHLSYQNHNRPICDPHNNPANNPKSKYSCACYEEIKNEHFSDEETAKHSGTRKRLKNSGRKPNNVVYGPLLTPKYISPSMSVFPCDVKQCCK